MRRRIVVAIALALVGLVSSTPGHAQGFSQVGFNVNTAAVALVTTTEGVVVSSGPVTCPRQTCDIVVIAFAQLTTGADTTAVVPRIRRGTAITGTLISEEAEENVKAAAGSIEPFTSMAMEQRSNVATVEYSFTLDQVGATANGSNLYATILVLVR